MRSQICDGCGKGFEAQRSSRHWCDQCKVLRRRLYVRKVEQRHRQEQGKREPHSTATCQWCGKTFLAMRSDAKTCSPECKRQGNLAKARKFERGHRGVCSTCGTAISRRYKHCLRCSQPDKIAKIAGPNNYRWKGGRRTDSSGYILVWQSRRTYRQEHILVWEATNGPLPEGQIIHHVNGVKTDNRLENLKAMPRSQHNHAHGERRIKELEAEITRLRDRLDGNLHA